MQLSVHEAETRLSQLIAAVERGEEVVITRGDKPGVRLVMESLAKPKRKLGALAGTLSDELLEHLTNHPALDQEIEDDFMAAAEKDFPR